MIPGEVAEIGLPRKELWLWAGNRDKAFDILEWHALQIGIAFLFWLVLFMLHDGRRGNRMLDVDTSCRYICPNEVQMG